LAAYRGYLRAFVARTAQERDDTFTSALLAIHDEAPEALTQEEIASILFSLSFAGHETTNYLIGNVVRRLLEEPARWDAVVADPTLIPGAVDETLRYDPSVPVWRRVTKRPVTLGGVDVPEGAKLFLWLAAAGRDASIFPEPERFDLRRVDASKTLALGKDFLPFVNPDLSKFLPHLHDRLTMNPARIIACPMTQHGHEDTQQSVANTA